MKRVFNNITDTEQELVVTLDRSEVEPVINAAYAEITKKVHLDGFRPGKVPLHLVKRMYGESIEADEHAKLAQKFMEEIFKEDNVTPVSQPHLHEIVKKDGGIEFALHYQHIPDFELADYKSIVVDEPVHQVTDEEIEKQLLEISYHKGKYETADVITDTNFKITLKDGKTTEVPDETPNEFPDETPNEFPDETPNEFPDETPNEVPDETPNEVPDETPNEVPDETPNEVPDVTDEYTVVNDDEEFEDEEFEDEEPEEIVEKDTFVLNLRQKNLYKELVALFMDKKVGDTVIWTPPQNEIYKNTDGDVDEKHFLIKKIEKIVPFEIDEEFVSKDSEGRFTTIEEYKEEIGFKLQEAWDNKSISVVENNIIDKLLEMHDIKIPQFLVEEQAVKMFDDFKSKNKLYELKFETSDFKDEYITQAAKIIKWDLIRDKIIKAENIQVEDFDLNDFIEKNFNYPGIDSSLYLEYIKENKQIINSILVKKVMNFLIDFTTTNEVEFAESELEFDDEIDEEFEDDEIFDEDEEFIDEDEFDDEFDEDDDEDFDDDDDDDDDEDDDDEEEDFDDEAKKK